MQKAWAPLRGQTLAQPDGRGRAPVQKSLQSLYMDEQTGAATCECELYTRYFILTTREPSSVSSFGQTKKLRSVEARSGSGSPPLSLPQAAAGEIASLGRRAFHQSRHSKSLDHRRQGHLGAP